MGMVRAWRRPSFCSCIKNTDKNQLFSEHFSEAFDQRLQPLLRHNGREVAEHAALKEHRMGAPFGGVGFEMANLANALSSHNRFRPPGVLTWIDPIPMPNPRSATMHILILAGRARSDGIRRRVL